MRPRNERRNRILEFGVLMLINELLNVGYDAIPPVTLVTIIGQGLLYIDAIDVPWNKWDVCISVTKVWNNKDYKSLILSTFEHADDMHLYYNMISFLVKGRTLEYKYGSSNFAILLAILSLMTPAIYVLIGLFTAEIFQDSSVLSSCAIGFSGVIFALKLITTLENPYGHQYVVGLPIPTKYAAWAELIAIHILVPNASFMGHLAGILAGLLYMKTYLGTIIDRIIFTFTGTRMVHYRMRWNYEEPRSYQSRRNGWNSQRNRFFFYLFPQFGYGFYN